MKRNKTDSMLTIMFPPLCSGLYELRYGDKTYVGESKNIQWRAFAPNHKMRELYGEPDFVIFHYMPNSTRKERMMAETNKMLEIGKSNCLNAMFANKSSEEMKRKISKANKGKRSHNKGKVMSKKSNKKRSKTLKGHSVSIETRIKISNSLKKRNKDGHQ